VTQVRSFLVVALVLGVLTTAASAAAAPPTLPDNAGGELLSLSCPPIQPGAQGSLSYAVNDPFNQTLESVRLSLDIYAFVTPTGESPVGPSTPGVPTWEVPGHPGGVSINLTLGNIAPGSSSPGGVGVEMPSSDTSGTYLVRSSLEFGMANATYVLRSRGWFSSSLWAEATRNPNGTPTLNLTLLNVSGVTPDTSIPVGSNPVAPYLYALLGISLVLAAIGGYLAVRPRTRQETGAPKSRRGVRRPGRRNRDTTADGSRETRAGD
jgi:hypothetical protein